MGRGGVAPLSHLCSEARTNTPLSLRAGWNIDVLAMLRFQDSKVGFSFCFLSYLSLRLCGPIPLCTLSGKAHIMCCLRVLGEELLVVI
jgi:hypothetical protein